MGTADDASAAPGSLYLDVTRLVHRWVRGIRPTGVDRVALAYVRRYAGQAGALVSVRGLPIALPTGASERMFRLLNGAGDMWSRGRRLRALVPVLGATGVALPSHSPQDGGTVLHTLHSGLEHGRYFRALHARGARTVVMVHDLIPLTHPHYCVPSSVQRHALRLQTVLRCADGIVTNSQATLDALAAYAGDNGLVMPPATVARLGVDVSPSGSVAQRSGRAYFVMVGTIEPRKNHWLILHLWRQLVTQWGNLAPQLVVIGRPGWKCGNELDMLCQCPELQDAVVHLPNCADVDMLEQLRGARALLFPSFIEGYGLPLVEALAMGVPVIASSLAVFREIAGEVPDYLDPLDGAGWLARIRSYAQSFSAEREQQLIRLAAFRWPTWSEHFALLERFLGRVAR